MIASCNEPSEDFCKRSCLIVECFGFLTFLKRELYITSRNSSCVHRHSYTEEDKFQIAQFYLRVRFLLQDLSRPCAPTHRLLKRNRADLMTPCITLGSLNLELQLCQIQTCSVPAGKVGWILPLLLLFSLLALLAACVGQGSTKTYFVACVAMLKCQP